jgi:hypothetical protein
VPDITDSTVYGTAKSAQFPLPAATLNQNTENSLKGGW